MNIREIDPMDKSLPQNYHAQTYSLNAGLQPDPLTNAISPNISMSVNHRIYPESGAFSASAIDDLTKTPYLYAGWTNPTVRQLETRLAVLEETEDTFATTTGMAALSSTFLSLLKKGDHMIISDICYSAVSELALKMLTNLGIEVSSVNLSKLDDVEKAIKFNTVLVHAETPCNPLLRLTDIHALSSILKARNILLSVDSTLATPIVTKPATLGADLVIHSLTKFINGHGDALGGCVMGRKGLIEMIRSNSGVYLGSAISAYNAWLIMRGIDTLYPRMSVISDSALLIANKLVPHPRVKAVNYPGLPSHPQHALARTQMQIYGGIISFQVDDIDLIEHRFAHDATLFYYAYSIGHQRSLAVTLKTTDMLSSYRLSTDQKNDYMNYAGDGLIRLSIGLENTHDLLKELQHLLR